MKKNQKGFMIFGLLALCVVLVVGLFLLNQGPKGEDDPQNTGDSVMDVTPSDISDPVYVNQPSATPTIEPPAIPTPTDEQTGSDIPLTVIEDKPDAPELPDTAYTGEPTGDATEDDVKAHEALDQQLTNPDVTPNITPTPVEPAKPAVPSPKSGDKDGNGNVYIPGFGWVKDEGGGTEVEESFGEGSLDVMVGH